MCSQPASTPSPHFSQVKTDGSLATTGLASKLATTISDFTSNDNFKLVAKIFAGIQKLADATNTAAQVKKKSATSILKSIANTVKEIGEELIREIAAEPKTTPAPNTPEAAKTATTGRFALRRRCVSWPGKSV